VADVADCPLQRLSAIVIKNIIIIIIICHFTLTSALTLRISAYDSAVGFVYEL